MLLSITCTLVLLAITGGIFGYFYWQRKTLRTRILFTINRYVRLDFEHLWGAVEHDHGITLTEKRLEKVLTMLLGEDKLGFDKLREEYISNKIRPKHCK